MTDVRLVKDCGLYPSYKKIIDFTGSKSEIIEKQLAWIDSKSNDKFYDVNYNKLQNKLVLPIDYEIALGYTYAVLTDLSGSTEDKPLFMFINSVSNLSSGDSDNEPSVSFELSLDPIMTFMGDWKIEECMIDRAHVDRWSSNSSYPIRIVPNSENVNGFYLSEEITEIKDTIGNEEIAHVVVAFIRSLLNMHGAEDGDSIPGYDSSYVQLVPEVCRDEVYYAIFPVSITNPSRHYKGVFTYKNGNNYDSNTETVVLEYPSLDDVLIGSMLRGFELPPEAIVSANILPYSQFVINEEIVGGNTCYYYGDNVPLLDVRYDSNTPLIGLDGIRFACLSFIGNSTIGAITSSMTAKNSFIPYPQTRTPSIADAKYMMQILDSDVLYGTRGLTVLADSRPVKPSNGVNASDIYEPALFISPFRERKIIDGKGNELAKIPANIILNTNQTKMRIRNLISGAECVDYIGINDDTNFAKSGIEGRTTTAICTGIDIVNDNWINYALTQRDTDRANVQNQALKNAIDNLIYMSYGGALVGSRSAGEEGYFNRTPVERTRNRDSRGRFAPGWKTTGGNLELTSTGHRVFGAIGLAGASSIVTSLVDAHTMWQNQLNKERAVANKPSDLLTHGSGATLVANDMIHYNYTVMKCDDINYQIGYENFRKYGYWIGKFEKPNINSRKYFNYLLTNGAIISGAINQEIRDVIASIFDAGVTIFHYDSGDTNTLKLEYTNKENIEVSLI